MGETKKLKQVKVADLKPYEKNAKTHSKKQIEQIQKSIEEFGFISPILIDENYNVIAGHGRIQAAEGLGIDKVPALFVEGLTEEQRRAYIIADNRLTELGGWDKDLLGDELEDLKELGFDINLTGFSIDNIGADDIDFSEVDKAWEEQEIEETEEEEYEVKTGQVYQLGRHRLMCGDSTNPEDVNKLLDGAVADLLITDPPYNVNYEDKLIDHDRIGFRSINHQRKTSEIKRDCVDNDTFIDFLTTSFLNAKNALKAGAAFYIFYASTNTSLFTKAIENADLQIREILVWIKNHFAIGRCDYHYRNEPIIYGWTEGAGHYFINDRTQDTVFDLTKINNLSEEELRAWVKEQFEFSDVIYEDKPLHSDLHPTQKPINLIKRLIINSSREGEIVLDLFGGSGTTLIASEQTNRTAYLMELDTEYAKTIIERYEAFTGEKAVLIKD